MNDRRRRAWTNRRSGGGDAVYGLGLIGALVFYISEADGFGPGWWGFSRPWCGRRSSSTTC
jgi:hypothetical protein